MKRKTQFALIFLIYHHGLVKCVLHGQQHNLKIAFVLEYDHNDLFGRLYFQA